MKTKLLFLLITMSLVGCSSQLDQQIKLSEYKTVMNELQAGNTEYTEKDFDTAGKIMAQSSFGAMMTGENPSMDITYGELLEKAQKKNEKYQKELAVYKKEVQKLKDVFLLKLSSGKYKDISDLGTVYSDGYQYAIKAINNSNQTISGFQGDLKLKNSNGEVVLTIPFKEAVKIPSNDYVEGSDWTIVSMDDNVMELKAVAFNNLTQEWNPSLIIFENGERMEAPDKP